MATEITLTITIAHPDSIQGIYKRLTEVLSDYTSHPNVETATIAVDRRDWTESKA